MPSLPKIVSPAKGTNDRNPIMVVACAGTSDKPSTLGENQLAVDPVHVAGGRNKRRSRGESPKRSNDLQHDDGLRTWNSHQN